MATAEGFDLYTCEVCFDNMLDKDPRMLSCCHSFCSSCLKILIKTGAISCPLCREITTVPNNDIYSLVNNFMLTKFRKYLQKVELGKIFLCKFCLAETATLKCQECSQLFCETCSEKHKAMKTFKDHKIYKLCDKHKDGMITHVCIKCARPACAKCVMTEHFDHETEIEKYQQGIETLSQKISKYEADVDEVINSVSEGIKGQNNESVQIKRAINKVKDILSYYIEKTRETENVLERLKQKEAKGKEIDQKYNGRQEHCLHS